MFQRSIRESSLEMLANQFDLHGFPVLSVRPLVKLSDLLTPIKIQCGLRAEDWKSAVSQAAEILLKCGDITSEFIDSTISTVSSAGPYFVISRGVALVHSAIGVGVNNLAMSLSTFPNGVRFNHPLHDPVRLVFCLAPIDNNLILRLSMGSLNYLIPLTSLKWQQYTPGGYPRAPACAWYLDNT